MTHTLRLLGIRFKTADTTKDCNPGGKKLHIHVVKNHNEEQMIPLNKKDEVMKNMCNADQHRLTMLLYGFDESKVNMGHVNFLRWFSKKYQESQKKKKLREEEKKKEIDRTNREQYEESTRFY